jgi:hypothetical protein
MAGHNKAGHYNLISRRASRVDGVRNGVAGDGQTELAGRRVPPAGASGRMLDAGNAKIVYRDSRCPGCHGQMTLKYARVRVGDSYRFHLLSPSPAHPVCAETLREIRRGNAEA